MCLLQEGEGFPSILLEIHFTTSVTASILCVDFTWPLLLLRLPSEKACHCVLIAVPQSKAPYSYYNNFVSAGKQKY